MCGLVRFGSFCLCCGGSSTYQPNNGEVVNASCSRVRDNVPSSHEVERHKVHPAHKSGVGLLHDADDAIKCEEGFNVHVAGLTAVKKEADIHDAEGKRDPKGQLLRVFPARQEHQEPPANHYEVDVLKELMVAQSKELNGHDGLVFR